MKIIAYRNGLSTSKVLLIQDRRITIFLHTSKSSSATVPATLQNMQLRYDGASRDRLDPFRENYGGFTEDDK